MKKLALILAFLIGSIASAFAACVGPVVMHDFPGTSFNMSVVTAPTGANDCQSNVAIPTWAGGTLGAMATYGTSPGAVLVPGVNAFVTNTLAGITMGDAITTGNFPTGSPVFAGLFNGATYDRPRSAGATGAASANNSAADPCQSIANSTARGSIATATTTRIITPSASNKTYICSVDLLAFAANNVAVVEGTGGTCGAGTAGVIGGTTTATGISFAAQGGLVKGGAGLFVWNTAGTNVDF